MSSFIILLTFHSRVTIPLLISVLFSWCSGDWHRSKWGFWWKQVSLHSFTLYVLFKSALCCINRAVRKTSLLYIHGKPGNIFTSGAKCAPTKKKIWLAAFYCVLCFWHILSWKTWHTRKNVEEQNGKRVDFVPKFKILQIHANFGMKVVSSMNRCTVLSVPSCSIIIKRRQTSLQPLSQNLSISHQTI